MVDTEAAPGPKIVPRPRYLREGPRQKSLKAPYKRSTTSSSLLHNFQPIRKTNSSKSPRAGGAAPRWVVNRGSLLQSSPFPPPPPHYLQRKTKNWCHEVKKIGISPPPHPPSAPPCTHHLRGLYNRGWVVFFLLHLYYFKLKKPPLEPGCSHPAQFGGRHCPVRQRWGLAPTCRSPCVTSAHPDLLRAGGPVAGPRSPPWARTHPLPHAQHPLVGWDAAGERRPTPSTHGGDPQHPPSGWDEAGEGKHPSRTHGGGVTALSCLLPLPLKQGKCCGKRLAPLLGSWSDWFGVAVSLGGLQRG